MRKSLERICKKSRLWLISFKVYISFKVLRNLYLRSIKNKNDVTIKKSENKNQIEIKKMVQDDEMRKKIENLAKDAVERKVNGEDSTEFSTRNSLAVSLTGLSLILFGLYCYIQ